MTQLAEGATQLHEMYTAYVQAGFTQEQAMQLVITFLTNAQLQGGGNAAD